MESLRPHAPGCEVVTVSAATGDVSALPYAGPGSTLVLLGASGAGGSTVVNALAGEPVMASCAVQASIDSGDLSVERMDSWRLQRELAWRARRTDARLQAEERAEWRAVHGARRGQVWRP